MKVEAPCTRRVLSYYALTEKFRSTIERSIGSDTEFATASRFRNFGPVTFLRAVKDLKATELLVAAEDDSAKAVVGPLLLLSALSGSRQLGIIWPDATVEHVKRAQILRLIIIAALDQVKSRAAYRRIARRMAKRPSLATAAPNNLKKILYLDANLSFGLVAGGSVGHTKGVIDALAKEGFEIDYASVKPIPTSADRTRGIKITPPNLYSFPAEFNYYSFAEEFERQVAQATADSSYAFLYQRMSLHNASGVELKRRLSIPLVLEYNGSEVWSGQNWATKLALPDAALVAERESLHGSDLVVTVSDVLAKEVEAAGVAPERIVHYPNCIDPQYFNPNRFSPNELSDLRKELHIDDNANVWTFIGTFGTWHGVDFLAEAVTKLVKERRPWLVEHRLHFLFVGDGPKMQIVRDELKHSLDAGFATLAGLVPQAKAPVYLAASNGFLSPHLPNADGTPFFGSPTKLFEYMAMERPIVAANLEQIGEVLRDERDNLSPVARPLAELFEPGNSTAFIEAFTRAVENADEARDMARRARREALRHYTWNNHVAKILDRLIELNLITDTKSIR